jgi:copper transport protein
MDQRSHPKAFARGIPGVRRPMRDTIMKPLYWLILLLTCLALQLPRNAQAHGYLVRSIPQDRTSIAKSPSRVQVWFSEGLEPNYSTLVVTNQAGERVDLGDGGVSPTNRAQLSVRLPPNLPDGAYVATMRLAFTSDGHIQTDTLVFWVGARGADVATISSTQDVYPLEIIARGLLTLGLLCGFGTLVLYRFALYPAWSNPNYPAGGLAPRVMDRLHRLILIATGFALIGQVLWIFEQSGVLFAADLGRIFRDSLWLSTLNTTQFGDIWKLRLVFIAASGLLILVVLAVGPRQPRLIFVLHSINTLVAGTALATLSIAGHAPGATLWPLAAISADWLHLMAAGAWVGGLIGLVWVLPLALRPLDSEGQRLALLAALRRFSPIALLSVGIMGATGAYAALTYVYTPAQLPDTAYGRTLVAKTLLVVPLLALGLVHHLALRPGQFKRAWGWLGRTLRAEAAIGATVFIAAAFLTATPPPIPPDARAKADLSSYTMNAADLTMTLTPNPGGVGANSYDLKLTKAGRPLDGAAITAQFIYPELDKRSPIVAFDSIGDGLYGAAGAELNRTGYWQVLFDVRETGSNVPVRLATAWLLPQQAITGADRPASPLNVLAALAIFAVLALWVVPRLQRRMQALGFDRQMLFIGAGAAILTVVVLGAGTFLIVAAARAFDDAANPRPAHINTVLPDAQSISGGLALAPACDIFQAAKTRPVDYLRARGDSTLFSELLARTDRGCAGLNDADRWNLINAMRFKYPPTP